MLLTVASPFRCVPVGVIDGANETFTLPHEPLPSTLLVFKRGVFQTPDGVDYTLCGNQIIFTTAPADGDSLYAQAMH